MSFYFFVDYERVYLQFSMNLVSLLWMNFWIICTVVKILKLTVDLDGVHAKIKITNELQHNMILKYFMIKTNVE